MKNDGGPAFPIASQVFGDFSGMTLRDYFAAAAMQGTMANPDTDFMPADAARWAYKVADAMLAERAK